MLSTRFLPGPAAGALLLVMLALGGIMPALAATGTPSPSPSAGVATPTDPNRRTFSVAPADSQGKLNGQSALFYGATPGGRLSDHVGVVNYSLKPVTLRVVAVDALNTELGGLTGRANPSDNVDLGSWIKLPPSAAKVTVPAATKAGPGLVVLPISVSVPKDATPGDHVAAILAVLSTAPNTPGGANVQLDQRVGTRVFMRVTGQLDPRLELSNLTADYHATLNPLGTGTMSVAYTIRNAGNVKLGGRVAVSVAGLFGSVSRPEEDQAVPLLLPGNEIRQTVEVPGVYPQFREVVEVRLSPLAAQNDPDPALDDVTALITVWAIPWPVIFVILVILVGAWLLWRWRRRGDGEKSGRVEVMGKREAPRGNAPRSARAGR